MVNKKKQTQKCVFDSPFCNLKIIYFRELKNQRDFNLKTEKFLVKIERFEKFRSHFQK